MEKNSNVPLRILMLPWLAHGHITPFLELSKKLITRNFEIYLCSTPATLSSSVKEVLPQRIQLIELILPESEQLPAELHTTNGLPPNLMDSLKIAFEKGKEDFERILVNLEPDFVMYDALQPWAPEAAAKHGIPAVHFIANGVTMSAFMLNASKNPCSEFPFPEIYYRDYEKDIAVTNMRLERSPNDSKRNWVTECIERSSGMVLFKSMPEIESKYINYLSLLSGKKVLPIGPLVPPPTPDDSSAAEIIDWLNNKEKRSTVFVAFGSEYFLDEQDRSSIAKGLELSNVNFIWVIRSPKGDTLDLDEALPNGFLQRVGDKGKILTQWAPQARILDHPSIGGFVSHCGWNSVMESMNFGVPVIAIPMHLDQYINARLVEHVGIGVEALKDENRKIQSEELAKQIIRLVIEDEKVRKKVQVLKAKIEAKGDDDIDVVASELVQLYQANKMRGAGAAAFPWKLRLVITKIFDFLKLLF